jgi:hypothetical protein
MRRNSLLVTALALGGSVGLVSADNGGRPFTTTLSGAEEVSSTGQLGVGDPDGTGEASLTLNQGQGEVCFAISVSNIDEPITRAHIHRAPAGANGGIAVPLVEPNVTPFTFTDGMASGCVTASADVIAAIRKNPEEYYVNVHNVTFPAGAVRGQLSK